MSAATMTNSKRRHQHVWDELRALGVKKHTLHHMATRQLPAILHEDEHIGGIVHGHADNGFALLVATDRRVIYLNVKPFFTQQDEVTYDVVSGVSFSHAGLWSTVTLNTRVKNYTMYTHNRNNAENFIAYIESRRLEHRMGNIY